jgi:hypothetical protein
MLLSGLLLNPALNHTESINTAIEIFTNLSQNPTAARLLEFIKALVPLVEKGNVPADPGLSFDSAVFDQLLNFDFNSFSGDTSLNWLMDLQ